MPSFPMRFDPSTQTVGLSHSFDASLVPAQPDPPIPVTGATFGVAMMTESAAHAGEMHPDGDEVLYLISGHAVVTLETVPVQRIAMLPGNGLVVPRGVWHTVDVVSPSQIAYITPGPNNQFRWKTHVA